MMSAKSIDSTPIKDYAEYILSAFYINMIKHVKIRGLRKTKRVELI